MDALHRNEAGQKKSKNNLMAVNLNTQMKNQFIQIANI